MAPPAGDPVPPQPQAAVPQARQTSPLGADRVPQAAAADATTSRKRPRRRSPTPPPTVSASYSECLSLSASQLSPSQSESSLALDIEAELREHPPKACCKRLRLALSSAAGATKLLPGWTRRAGTTNPWRLHNHFLTSWLVPCPRLMLFAGPFRLAVAMHCGMPIFASSAHCQYTPSSTGRCCAAPLGQASQHVMTCAFAPRMQRHNFLRDAWAQLFKQAGWTVRLEQLVPTTSEPKRADLIGIGPSGEIVALDVMVTAPPDLASSTASHLFQQARAKARRYHVLPADTLPDGSRMIPLIHGAVVPFLEHHAMEFFHRLARQASQRRDPGSPAYWQPSLHSWAAASAASFIVPAARAAFRMHASCGDLAFM